MKKKVLLLALSAGLIFNVKTFAKTKVVEITVWAEGNKLEHMRADAAYEAARKLNEELKKEGKDVKIVVKAYLDSSSWGNYKKKFTLAAAAGKAPDIVLSGHEDIAVWAHNGYIIPIAKNVSEVKKLAPEFADVIDSLWKPCQWHGKVWAVPQDTEVRPLFFSKTKLKELGWTDKEIAELPEKIKNGEFTLDDMIKVAKEAVKKGVVKKGYGYWHRPRKGGDFIQYYFSYGGYLYDPKTDKLVVVKDALKKWYAFQRRCVTSGITPENYIGTPWKVWHDTVSHDKVLFWNGGIWQWADWAQNYVKDLGGEKYLFAHVGYALQPSGIKGKHGGTLSHPLVYMITSYKASRRPKENDKYVLMLLEKMTTKEINTKHAISSTHLGILKSELNYPPYKNNKFLSSVSYMLNYSYYQPNHPMYGALFDILWNGMVAAENGRMTPEAAAENAIQQIKFELGDAVEIK